MYWFVIYELDGRLWTSLFTSQERAIQEVALAGKGIIIGPGLSVRNYGLVEDLVDHSDEIREK